MIHRFCLVGKKKMYQGFKKTIVHKNECSMKFEQDLNIFFVNTSVLRKNDTCKHFHIELLSEVEHDYI